MRKGCGTPNYLSPEAIYASIDYKKYCYDAEKQDIYALGLSL
jgi:hypothetical protein